VGAAELHRRLLNRRREDDRPDIISTRLDQFEKLTEPLISYYAATDRVHNVDGTDAPDEVFDSMLALLAEMNR